MTDGLWGRAREMGGGNFMVFSWHGSREECEAEITRKPGAVKMIPIFVVGVKRNGDEK